jgi:hypothetical protein
MCGRSICRECLRTAPRFFVPGRRKGDYPHPPHRLLFGFAHIEEKFSIRVSRPAHLRLQRPGLFRVDGTSAFFRLMVAQRCVTIFLDDEVWFDTARVAFSRTSGNHRRCHIGKGTKALFRSGQCPTGFSIYYVCVSVKKDPVWVLFYLVREVLLRYRHWVRRLSNVLNRMAGKFGAA